MKNKNHIKIKRNRFSGSLSFWVFFVVFSAIICGGLNICLAMNYDAGDALKKNDVLQKTKENLLGSYFNSSKVATASESSQNSVGRTVSGENSKGMEDVDNGNGGIVANVFSFFRKAYCGAFWRIDDDCGVELFSSVSPNQEEILRTNQEVSEKNEIYTEGDGYNRIITGNGLSVVLNQDAPQEIHQEFLEINSALKLRGHSLSLSSRGLKVSNSYDDDFLTKDTNFKGDVGGNYKNIAIRDGVIGFSNWSSNSCANGQIPKYNGSVWVCGDDGNDVYSAGDGLQLVGGEFSAKLNGSSLSSGAAGLSINLGNANIWTETQTFSKAIVAPTTVDTINGLVVNAGALSNVASITGSGALSVTSNTTNALTLDSGTTGAVDLGTGANAKTITIGNTTAGTTIAINAGDATTGNINFDSNTLYVDTVNNNVGIGITTPSSKLHVLGATEQLRLAYDDTYYSKFTVNSTGGLAFAPSANSTTAYNFTNAAGTSVLNVDSTNGRVGIGTATPAYSLHVAGDGYFSSTTGSYVQALGNGTLTVKSALSSVRFSVLNGTSGLNVAPWNGYITFGGNQGNANQSATTLYPGIADSASAVAYIFDTQNSLANSTARLLSVRNATTPVFDILASGNVGIGTTSPTGRLDIAESGAKTAVDYGLYLANTATSATASINKYGMYISSTGTWNGASANNYGLYVDTPTGGTNNYAAIFAGGNVGIGTTTPSSKLHVLGTTEQLRLAYDDTYYSKFTVNSAGGLAFAPSVNSTTAYNFTNAAGTSVLNVDSTNGRVGVGTISPTSEFHIKSTRTTGLAPFFQIEAGKDPINAAAVSFMRSNNTQQALFAFETGSSSNPDGYVGTIGGVENRLLFITDTGARGFAIDATYGLAIGTLAQLSSATFSGVTTKFDLNGGAYFAGNVGIGTTDLDGTPAIGRLTVKGSTNDGSTNIFVGRDSDEANVFSLDTNGKIILNNAVMIKNYAGHVQIRTPGDTNQANIDAGAFYGYGSSATQPIHSFSYDSDTGINNGGGSGNNDILNLIAGGVVGLNIVETGGIANVGIGNTSPTGKLDIAESGTKTAVDYGLYLANTATSATASINKYGMYISSTGTWNGASANNYGLYVDTPTGGTNNYAAIFAGGNVGIGTTTPSSKLHVLGTTEQLRLAYDDTYYSKFTVNSAGGLAFAPSVNSTTAYNFTNAAGTSVLNVDSTNGRVGVGTISPTSEFHIKSTRTTGLAPFFQIEAGKDPINAAAVSFMRSNNTQQALFAFETGSSSNPDGYVGTIGGVENRLLFITDTGARGFAIDATYGLAIGTLAQLSSATFSGVTTRFDLSGGAYFAGNVGIGVTSPTGRLHIAESGAKTAVDYGLYLANTATSATDSVNKYGMYISSTGTWSGTSANNYGLYVDTPTGGTNNYAAIFAGGNVGIGTASPTDQLYIYADSGSKGFSIKNPNPYVTLSVAGTSNFSTFGYSSSNAIAQWSSNAGMLLSGGNITLTSNNGAGNVVMNGLVGIGTTAPDNNLEINSATGGTMRLTYNDNNGSATDYSTLGVSASGLTTLTTVDSDGASGHIALMPDGNVGIGTASPDNTLSVKGSGTGTIAIGQLSDSTSTGAIGFTPGGALSTSNYALAGSQTGTILNAPSSGAINFRIGNTTKMLMDTNGNVGIGMTSIRTIGGAIRKFNIEGDTTSVASISLIENYNNVYGSSIYLGKTRGSSIGSNTIVQNGDTLGSLAFVGSDGVDMDNTAARISSLVDGTPAADKIPANIIFYVKPDSAVALSEAARISSSGNFGIGNTSPTGKLDIAESGAKTAVDYGLYLANTATSSTASINKYGMYISSTGTWSGTSANNYGLYVDTPTGGTNNYAAIFAGGNVGIGTTTPDQALDVIGTIQASNLLGGATNITTDANGNIIRDPSDQRLKENIQTITGALDKVMMLRGVSYEWKDKKKMGNQADFGLIAQEVQGVVPELATESAEGIMGVKYTNAVGLLINAIKEQQGEIQNMGIAFSTKDLVAENIKASHIEGLEFMQKDIVDGKEEAKNLAEAIKLMESQIALLEKDNEKLKDDSEAVSRVLGVSDKAVSFAVNVSVLKNLAVSGGLTVDDSAVFKKDVEFQGNVAYNTSAAGFAKIKKGDKKVEVDFDRPFANTPIIMVNAQDSGISFAVSDESRSGFVIKTKKEAEDDINFSWTAVHVKGAKTYKSDGGSSSSGSAVSATSLNESETTSESSSVDVSVSSATSSSSATNESSSSDNVSDLSTGDGDNL